ncbi:unnamed protein product [Durusdinium trenchii]|uniref:Uncharacterized protein n=1 Tax=Durusdinium trenchii TaxID=1381693 RepID=A0ABP0IVE8_9DINO
MSALYEQSTPEVLEINDTVAKVNILSFTDQDLDEGQLGGNISWRPPQDTSQVTHYRAYLAEDAAGHIERSPMFLETPVGTNQDLLPTDSTVVNATHLLIYTVSSLVEQSTPDYFLFFDMMASVSNVIFLDKDADFGQVGGVVEWQEPSDTSRVTHYVAYFSQDAAGLGKSQIGVDLPEGELNVTVPADTQLSYVDDSAGYAVVFTRSFLTEQTTPRALEVSDTASSIPYLHFTDLDLDEGQIGGYMQWQSPEDNGTITHYRLYAAEDELGTNRTRLSEVAFGTTEALLPADFDLHNYTHLLIYAKTEVSEQTVPTFHVIKDEVAIVSHVNLADKDLDPLELGGTITWSPPDTLTLVTGYVVYLAQTAAGAERDNVNGFISVATSDLLSKTLFKTQDTVGRFREDLDLDLGDLGGEVAWQPSLDVAQVTGYFIYFSPAADGAERSLLGNTSDSVDRIGLSHNQKTGTLRHVLVYASSSLAEQSTPLSLPFNEARTDDQDTDSSVSAVNFTDRDLDAEELGGLISWAQPEDASLVTHFLVYLAEDQQGSNRSQDLDAYDLGGPITWQVLGDETLVSSVSARGSNRSQLGTTEVGTDFIDVPVDFVHNDTATTEIYTRSYGRTPTHAEAINNTNSSVSNIVFLDDDLDDDELGGNISWQLPEDLSQVSHYLSYLADDSNRSQIGSALSVQMDPISFLEAEQPQLNYTQVLVYTRSVLAEQTSPAVTEISDTFATVQSPNFTDQDLDEEDLGGTLSWLEPADNARSAWYVIYLSTDAVGAGRQMVGATSIGTNELQVPADTTRAPFNFFTLFTRSALAEQTTPVALALSDTIASISSMAFLDLDLDEEELGGTFLWQPPDDQQQVFSYEIYLSNIGSTDAGLHPNGTKDWTQLPNGSVPVGTHDLQLLPDYPSAASFVLIYTRSLLVEQTTPVGSFLNDSVASVRNVSFTDLDLDNLELGGNVTWDDPPVEEQGYLAEFFDVYLSEGAFIGRSHIHSAPAGTNFASLAPETDIRSFSEILVFTRSTLTEQTTPRSFHLSDVGRYVLNLNFPDQDLDAGELGGNVSWSEPQDSSLVANYVVYLADLGGDRVQAADTTEVGSTVVAMNPDTLVLNYTHVVVYTQSSLVEQSTPRAINISDSVASVSGVQFVDEDLDVLELGGEILWTKPLDDSFVTFYDVYLGNSSMGAFRSQLGLPVPVGTLQTFAPVDLPQELRSHILVYTRSVLVEQSTPTAIEISDTVSDVLNVTFIDEDLDLRDLGGYISWEHPLDVKQVTAYHVYISQDPAGLGRSQISEILVNESLRAFLRSDQPLSQYTDVLVYSESSLAEQTTPVALKIYDAESLVINANFTDQDLDGEELGGTVEWQQSGDYHLVVAYDLYLARSASGVSRSRLNESLASDVFRLDLAPELPLDMATHVVIYTRSSLVEQTTPVAINISDADWNVQWVSFYDMDLDGGQLGGGISWAAPAELTLVTHYVAYLAANASGDLRSQIGSHVPVGTNYVDLPPETPMDGVLTNIVVYTKSALVEQTTPTSMEVNDTSSSVSNIVFVDNDLDEMELGGNITWSTPVDSSQVTLYSVYLSTSFDAENRSIVAEDVSIGTNTALLPAETAMRWFTYVNIYTKSPVIEQTTPASLFISDTIALIADLELVDQDLDATEIGGNVSWKVLQDFALISHFSVYFTDDTSWQAARLRAGQDVQASEYAELFIPAETDPPLATYGFLSVFPSSSLAERTTPFSAVINDTISPVYNISFVDLDMDLQDLGGTIAWNEPLEASQVTHYLVYLTMNASEGQSLVAEVPSTDVLVQLAPETPAQTFIVVFSRSVLVESTTPDFLTVSDSFSQSEVNFTDKDLDGTQIGGVISWSIPVPDFRPLVEHFFVYLSDFGNRSQLGNGPWSTREVSVQPELYYAPHTHVAVFAASSLVEQSTPSTTEIVDTDASVSNILFQDKDLDADEMGGYIFWTAPTDSLQVTYYNVFLRDASSSSQIAGDGPGGLVPLGVEQEFIPAETAIASWQEVAIYTQSSLVEQSTAVALPIIDEIASVSGVVFDDIDQDIDVLGGQISWEHPNDTSEVSFYVGYFANFPGATYGSRRQEFEVASSANYFDLSLQTPQSGYSYISVYTKSSLAEQTTPTSIDLVDFCQNVPTLENTSLTPEQGTLMLDYYEVPELVITKFFQVSEDGLSVEFAPLRKGPITMIITSTTAVVGMTSAQVQALSNAIGGSGCQIAGDQMAACTNTTLHLTGCALDVGGLHQYRLWILQEDETSVLPETAHIDFMIASVVFTQGPLLYFRNMTAVAIQYIPSHEGFEWLYAVALANGLADQVQADGDYSIWSQRVKSMYLAEGGACQSAETPILGQEVKISFLLNCSFELGQAYRIFVLLEDGSNRNDGTLKTLDFVYQGEMTLDSAIPYSHPVPSSDRWRIVPMTSVADWRIQRIRMFSDVTCTHPVDVYPSPYLDPLWSTVQEGDPLPNGAAFSYPGPLSSSNDVFKDVGNSWASGQHCAPGACHIGFSFGGGNGDLRVSTKVGCVEVTQSEVTGEFAESLELQYHDGTAFVAYRQAFGLSGGYALVPTFNGTVGVHVDPR